MNIIGEVLVRMCPEITPSFMDANRILWEVVEDKWIGKRSVWTFDNRACWLEETTHANVKDWWCGENANYNEVFNRSICDKSCA